MVGSGVGSDEGGGLELGLMGECGSGNLHCVKLWEAEEDEDDDEESGWEGRLGVGRSWGGGGSGGSEDDRGKVGEWGVLVGLRTVWVQWRKKPQEKSWVLSFG